nr:MAG TPA: hypothetical protein [Caudoviricetes sp.]
MIYYKIKSIYSILLYLTRYTFFNSAVCILPNYIFKVYFNTFLKLII